MKSTCKALLAASLTALILSGCASSISPNTYGSSSAGQVNRVVAGVVVSARPVQVASDSNLIGTVTGAAAGGLVGSTIGHNTGSLLAALGGAVIGGAAGNYAEKTLDKQTGIEYIVRTKDGSLLSVVQGMQPAYQRGQHVLIEYGDRARVVPDPDFQ